MIGERWSEGLAHFPALTAWQFCVLAYLQKPIIYFPTLFILFCLEIESLHKATNVEIVVSSANIW
jgi:hypothetical protein